MHAKLPKKSASAVQRDGVKLFFMLLPCLIFVFIFSYLPLWGWSYSFFNYKPGKALLDCEFVGWDHFTRLFGNPVLRRQLIMVLCNTLAMAGLGVLFSPLTPVFAICMSELTNRRYRKIVQTLTTLPHFISWTIMYSLVFFMLNVNTGFINNLLVQTGVLDQPVNFLVSQDHVWLTMQGYGLWKGLGWGAIVYMAAIAGIDQELYEAARIDGAGRWQQTLHVTLPGISSTIIILLILRMGSVMSVGYEKIILLYNDGILETADVISSFVYRRGLLNYEWSYSTAVGLFNSVINFVLIVLFNRLSRALSETSLW